MARSSYIYLVFDDQEYSDKASPLALFTVKWEAFMWIDLNGNKRHSYTVYRSRDGGKYEPVEITENG